MVSANVNPMVPVREACANLPAMSWTESDTALSTTRSFRDFAEAFAFMTRVALLAEARQHHPDMTISWNVVTISLATHDAGNRVTDLDRQLAASIDAIGVA